MFSTCGQHFYRWRFPSVERTFIISLKAVEHVDMQVKNLLSKSFFFPSLFCFFLSTLSLKVSCSFCCILCWSLLQKILFSTNKTQCEIITWYVERVHRCISTNGDWICNKNISFRLETRVRKMDGVDSRKKKSTYVREWVWEFQCSKQLITWLKSNGSRTTFCWHLHFTYSLNHIWWCYHIGYRCHLP